MSLVETMIPQYTYFRHRTLGLLDRIAQEPEPQAVLAWRPGPGRAHMAWQLLHVAVTEDIFASERLAPDKTGRLADIWSRYRGGSTPDDDVPSVDSIRQCLADARESLIDTLRRYGDDRLNEIPPAFAERKMTVRDVLHLIAWHEAHHQGQAHVTFNLYKNR